jgi:hypothetical protein
MSEAKTRLEWVESPRSGPWKAIAGAVALFAWDDRWYIRASGEITSGTASSNGDAQLAAEAAALSLLREGVEALGGRVIAAGRFVIGDRVRVTFSRDAPYDPPILDGAVVTVFADEIVVAGADGAEHWAFRNEVALARELEGGR